MAHIRVTKCIANKAKMENPAVPIVVLGLIFGWGIYCVLTKKIPIHYTIYTRKKNPILFWFYIIAFIGLPIACSILIGYAFLIK